MFLVDRFQEELPFVTEAVETYCESPANGDYYEI